MTIETCAADLFRFDRSASSGVASEMKSTTLQIYAESAYLLTFIPHQSIARGIHRRPSARQRKLRRALEDTGVSRLTRHTPDLMNWETVGMVTHVLERELTFARELPNPDTSNSFIYVPHEHAAVATARGDQWWLVGYTWQHFLDSFDELCAANKFNPDDTFSRLHFSSLWNRTLRALYYSGRSNIVSQREGGRESAANWFFSRPETKRVRANLNRVTGVEFPEFVDNVGRYAALGVDITPDNVVALPSLSGVPHEH